MKKLWMIAAASPLLLASAFAADRIYKPHSATTNPAVVVKLRDAMGRLEGRFLEVEDAYTGSQPDFEKILSAANRMEESRKEIELIVPDREWQKPLADLTSQLRLVRKSADRKDAAGLRKNIDGLYDACFRCHATEAPRRY